LSAPEILFERKGLSGDFEQSGAQREETAGAVGGGVKGAEPILLESNQNHATVQTDGISTALPASMGMGGGYVPMVVPFSISFQERAGKPGGGKGGANYTEDVCPPILSDSHGTPHAVAYGISSYDSNAMKSPNPHSGIYEADTARTLDLNG
jgi:DNA (cytosine-5)-methyltransferase 1